LELSQDALFAQKSSRESQDKPESDISMPMLSAFALDLGTYSLKMYLEKLFQDGERTLTKQL
jgi:hypothetical protein